MYSIEKRSEQKHSQQQIVTIDWHVRSMTFVADVCKAKFRTLNVCMPLAGDLALWKLVNEDAVLSNAGGVVTVKVCS